MPAWVMAAAAEEEGGFWETAYPVLPHPGELIAGLVFLALLYLLVAKVIVPRLEKAFEERREAIQGGVERAERAQAESDAALQQYKAQLADARGEANRIREEARQQGASIVAEMREQAQAEAERITTAARTTIEAERAQASAQLRAEVGRLATDLASRIVGESLQEPARQSGVVDRFLAELESSPRDVATR